MQVSLQGNQNFAKDDNYFMVDEPKRLRLYLPKQLVVVKELLESIKFEEKTFAPSKTKMQKERNKLKGQVLSLTSNSLDQKKECQGLKESTFLKHMICDLQSGMDACGVSIINFPIDL